MTMDKEYFENYYQDHKKEYRGRQRKWYKNNPEKAKAKNERYLKKLLAKRKKATNKTNYSGTSLEGLFIRGYGKGLGKTKDDVTHTDHKKRMVCVDCLECGTKECPGWDKCKYKEEILETIKNQKIKKGG